MGRPATGRVIEWRGKHTTSYRLKFTAYGKRRQITCGPEVTTKQQAQVELENVLADVRRGRWQPPLRVAPVREPSDEPTFHVFSSEWYARRAAEGLSPKTLVDLRWSLTNHLLPFFKDHRLSEITAKEVDRYKAAKVTERAVIEQARAAAHARGERFSERGLSNGSINHTLRHLAQVLETAFEYARDEGWAISYNAAVGKRRRLTAKKPDRPWVEPEQLMALLDAAKKPDGTTGLGRVLLGLLAGTGLRIGEALALRWQHVDLGTGSLHVVDAKTPKGIREVHLSPALREELALWRADAAHIAPGDFVIPTSTGRRQNASNLRRLLHAAAATANGTLAEAGIAPLGRVTFHSLRRTYASLRCACGDDIRYTADQLGHEDPRFTLSVYAKATKRRDRLATPQLRAYDLAISWAALTSVMPDSELQEPAIPRR